MKDRPPSEWTQIVIGRLQGRIVYLQEEGAAARAELTRLRAENQQLRDEAATCRCPPPIRPLADATLEEPPL